MKINELNEVGAPHLPAPRGAHLPAVVKPTPLGTEFRDPDPRTGAKPNATAKPAPDVTDVSYRDAKSKPTVAEPKAAEPAKGTNWKKTAAAVAGAGVVGAGLYGLSQTGKDKPNTQTATTTTGNSGGGPINPPPVSGKPQQNLNYKGSEGSQSLMALNPDKIKNVNQIKAGDSIDLGGGNMYKIQKGDTLDKIAQRMTRPSGQPRAELDRPDSVLPGPSAEKPPAPVTPPETSMDDSNDANASTFTNPNTSMDDSNDANASTFTNPNTSMDDSNDANASAFVNPAVSQTNNDILTALRKPPTQAATTTPTPEPVKGTPENPYDKGPEVKNASGETWKDREGNAVRTRSDAEIGDTNPRTGVVTPGSYDARMAAGEKNMQRLKDVGNKIKGWFNESTEELNRIRKLSGMPELMEAGMPAYMQKPAPTPATAPTTATNASSLRTMQNQAGTRTGTTGPAAQAKPTASSPVPGIGAPTAGAGRGNAQAELAARRAATPTQAATTAGSKMVKPVTPAGPPVGSQAQTASGANELAKTGIMGGQPAPTAAPATMPGVQAQTNVAGSPTATNVSPTSGSPMAGIKSPATMPGIDALTNVAGSPTSGSPMAGIKSPATMPGIDALTNVAGSPTSGSPMAGIKPNAPTTQAATTSTAGSGTANNTTMTQQQGPAQSAMNQASADFNPNAGNASSLRAAQNSAGSQTGTTNGSDATVAEEDEKIKMRESTMELNLLRKYSGLSELTESDVTVHKGTYGNSYGKEDVRDQYGHKIGKVDKGAEAKKDAPKRGRGRPTKGDKDEHGNDTKFDTSGLQGMLGGKPKGEVGKKSVKHSLKDWMEVVSDNMINEGEGDFETALSKLGGNWSHWHKIDSHDPNVDEYNFDDGEGGYYAQGNIEHNLETGQVTVDYSDEYDNDVKGTFDSFGEAMRALRGGGGGHGGKAPNFDRLGHRELHTSNDLRKTDRTGRKGTLAGGPTNRLKQSIQHNKGNLGPKGILPEQGMFEGEEKKTMSRAAKGHEKYGKEGMQALAKAGRDGASEKKLDTIRNKYDKYDKIEENRDAYQRDHDSSVRGMGTDHEFRNRERNAGLEDEKNNYAVHVDGKQWKVFDDKQKAENIARSLTKKGKNAKVYVTGANVSEAKDLPGKQDKLDVAPPKGKLDAKDFAALRNKKKKVDEARVMEESEYTYEKVGKTLAQENPTLASDSDEFANAVYHEMIQMGMTPKSAHYKLNHDPDFLGEVATAFHHYLGQGTVDEGAGAGRGSVNPPVVNPNTPAPAARTASPGWGKDDYKPLVPDNSKTFKPAVSDPEGVKEAGSFIRNLASTRKAFEGKNMKDLQLESWSKELDSLLNENLTISTTIDDQGHDSVNVSATEGNAHEIIELLRNAGLGGLGGAKQEHGQEVNNYGLPMSSDEHHGPEAQLIAVGDPHAHDSMGDEGGDDMLALIKKMTGIEAGGEEGGQDYEHEEGHEGHDEHNHEDSECEECGQSPCECDDEHQEVDEADMEEGNMFTGNLAKAREQGKSQADLDGDGDMEKVIDEADMEEGNMFTGNLAKARAQGKEHADLDGDGDMEKVDEGHDTCNECGGMMYEGHSCGSEQLEEYANDADDTADQDIAYMMRTLSGGGGMGEKRSQATAPIVKIVTAEGTLMRDSTDLLSDFRKLSGI
jgi:hypothetical protein